MILRRFKGLLLIGISTFGLTVLGCHARQQELPDRSGVRSGADRPVPREYEGVASFYGADFAGKKTANGEVFNPNLLTAAHKTLPFGTWVKIKNPENGREVRVRINDRGPFVPGRDFDLSHAAARQIGLDDEGITKVQWAPVKSRTGNQALSTQQP